MARGVGDTRAEHEIYLVAVGRMARTSLKLATGRACSKNLPQLIAAGAGHRLGQRWRYAASLKLDAGRLRLLAKQPPARR